MDPDTYYCDLMKTDPVNFIRMKSLPPRIEVRLHTRRLYYMHTPKCYTVLSEMGLSGAIPFKWLTLWDDQRAQNVGISLQRLMGSDYGLTEGRWFMDKKTPVDPMVLILEEGEPDATENIWKLVEAHITEVIHPRLTEFELDIHSTPIRWTKPRGKSDGTPCPPWGNQST